MRNGHLVRRNQQASVTIGIAALVLVAILGLSFHAIYAAKEHADEARLQAEEAREQAETTLTALQNEQTIKRDRGKHTAPFFVRDAKVSADLKQFMLALAQVNVALEHDPEQAEGRLLQCQLLIVTHDFAAAREALEQYVRQWPADKDAVVLLELCRNVRPEDGSSSAPFVEVFLRQKAFSLAVQMSQDRKKLLGLYRQQVETAWPGLGNRLTMDKAGKYQLSLGGYGKQVHDVTFLRGMPLTTLHLAGCTGVRDLSPLRGMPLTTLNLAGCGGVRDLGPLQGMPLTRLYLADCTLRDLGPLHGMNLEEISLTPKYFPKDGKSLDVLRPMESVKKIIVKSGDVNQGYSAEEFWKKYDAGEFK